ncbi:hypothetical protein QE390_004366 [Siphonobacter sp. SORGH_AS 1065]|nr:hypothetical protein [Siphonobacter sp. SORGH_AS_1065]
MYLDEFGRELGNTYAIFEPAEKFMNGFKLIAQILFPGLFT